MEIYLVDLTVGLYRNKEERHCALGKADRRIRRQGAARPRRDRDAAPAPGARPRTSCAIWPLANTPWRWIPMCFASVTVRGWRPAIRRRGRDRAGKVTPSEFMLHAHHCESACDLTNNRLPTVTLVGRAINSSIQCVAVRGLGSDLDADRASDPTPNNRLADCTLSGVAANRLIDGHIRSPFWLPFRPEGERNRTTIVPFLNRASLTDRG